MDLSSFLHQRQVPHIVVAKYSSEMTKLLGAFNENTEMFGQYLEFVKVKSPRLYYDIVVDMLGLGMGESSIEEEASALRNALRDGEFQLDYRSASDFINQLPGSREDHIKASRIFSDQRRLKPSTWIAHFTRYPWTVAAQGFKIGAAIDNLGNTTGIFSKEPGYNFGFVVDHNAATTLGTNFEDNGDGQYGYWFVLFQAAAIEAYHWGDRQNQAIFYGPHVDSMIVIGPAPDSDSDMHSGFDYAVYSKDKRVLYRTFSNEDSDATQGSNCAKCAEWAIDHYAQYQAKMVWRTPKRSG